MIKLAETQSDQAVFERENHVNEELRVVLVIARVIKAIIVDVMPSNLNKACQGFVESEEAKEDWPGNNAFYKSWQTHKVTFHDGS